MEFIDFIFSDMMISNLIVITGLSSLITACYCLIRAIFLSIDSEYQLDRIIRLEYIIESLLYSIKSFFFICIALLLIVIENVR